MNLSQAMHNAYALGQSLEDYLRFVDDMETEEARQVTHEEHKRREWADANQMMLLDTPTEPWN